jgi:hypothetical protein
VDWPLCIPTAQKGVGGWSVTEMHWLGNRKNRFQNRGWSDLDSNPGPLLYDTNSPSQVCYEFKLGQILMGYDRYDTSVICLAQNPLRCG